MSDHYETLGVSKDASEADIKRAYRQKARKSHPDLGGTDADFDPVAKAYQVLRDPERRRLYDATGEDVQRAPIEVEAQNTLLMVMRQALIECEANIVESVRAGIRNGSKKYNQERKAAVARIESLKTKRARLHSKGEENLFHQLIDREIEAINAQIESIDHSLEIGKVMAKMLDNYSEDGLISLPPPEYVSMQDLMLDMLHHG